MCSTTKSVYSHCPLCVYDCFLSQVVEGDVEAASRHGILPKDNASAHKTHLAVDVLRQQRLRCKPDLAPCDLLRVPLEFEEGGFRALKLL